MKYYLFALSTLWAAHATFVDGHEIVYAALSVICFGIAAYRNRDEILVRIDNRPIEVAVIEAVCVEGRVQTSTSHTQVKAPDVHINMPLEREIF